MKAESVSFKSTHFFSDIVNDYIAADKKLAPFYNNLPNLEGFKHQINAKVFDAVKRENLCKAIQSQYEKDKVKLNKKHNGQLKLLADSKTFTVTTGHQLCLFTGPLYFIYKIVSAIRLSEELSAEYPEFNFVPIYWMATEDHDFDEISFFNLAKGRVKWKTDQKGAVGRMNIDQLDDLVRQLEVLLPEYSSKASKLKELFKQSYKKASLAAATRYLVAELFKDEDLLIIDGDDSLLKAEMVEMFTDELLNQNSDKDIQMTSRELSKHYKIQVNPREINLFYLEDQLRERIVRNEDGNYSTADRSIDWTKEEILAELNAFPKRFSPNVVLRPLYQETVLPNIAYIGGGGELAYWFQLKSMFNRYQIEFPILMLRNSAVFLNQKEVDLQLDCQLSNEDLFKDFNQLMNARIKSTVKYDLTLNDQKTKLDKVYQSLIADAEQIDQSLAPHVKALLAKNDKYLSKLSKKFERAFKRKEEVYGQKIHALKTNSFPNDSLQERHFNFSELYLTYGDQLIEELKTKFSPLDFNFTILKEA